MKTQLEGNELTNLSTCLIYQLKRKKINFFFPHLNVLQLNVVSAPVEHKQKTIRFMLCL